MLKKSLLVMSTACLLSASTTMCYKKNHIDPSTISSVVLDGGGCDGKYSVEDMKKNGYKVDSMKLQNATDGLTYIYVFKKDNVIPVKVAATGISNEQLKAQLKEQIQEIKKETAIEEKKEEIQSSLQEGEKLYNTTCKRCHGDGTKKAFNKARPLKTLSLEDIQLSIRDISNGTINTNVTILMKPYAESLSSSEIKNIYNYLNNSK